MNRLTLLANKYGTDKGTVIHDRHGYTFEYDKYIKETGDYSLLEIGFFIGNSAKMWKEWNPQMKLSVADCSTEFLKFIDPAMLEKYYQVDQATMSDMKRITAHREGNPFDFIIDDGGHSMNHHQVSLAALFPCLKSGGGYFIEDLHTCDIPFYIKMPEASTKLILRRWQETGIFNSPYLSVEENQYLTDSIGSVTWMRDDKLALLIKV